MKLLKKLILENLGAHPEIKYYLKLSKKAENNVKKHPDICIECCNSLIQGICKFIIVQRDDNIKREDLKRASTKNLIEKTTSLISEDDSNLENGFINSAGQLALAVSRLRNKRCEISHGQAAPKAEYSSLIFAQTVYQTTEALTSYLLDAFCKIEVAERTIKAEEERIQREKELLALLEQEKTLEITFFDDNEETDLEETFYEDNTDFNDYLDGEYGWSDSKVIYSQALFELYYEDYLVQLDDYKDQLEEQEEPEEME